MLCRACGHLAKLPFSQMPLVVHYAKYHLATTKYITPSQIHYNPNTLRQMPLRQMQLRQMPLRQMGKRNGSQAEGLPCGVITKRNVYQGTNQKRV